MYPELRTSLGLRSLAATPFFSRSQMNTVPSADPAAAHFSLGLRHGIEWAPWLTFLLGTSAALSCAAQRAGVRALWLTFLLGLHAARPERAA